MNIGNNILELRKEKGLSQEQLGELIRVTRQTISNWELNETIPDTNQLIALSKSLNISIDDLVNNEIKNIVVEKVSNTEKLAGLIIKILKAVGIIIIINVVLMILAFIAFTVFRKQPETSEVKSLQLTCSINENDYVIDIGSDAYFNCSNCDKQMQVYLKDITDWANLSTSEKNIKTYFEDNGGTCE